MRKRFTRRATTAKAASLMAARSARAQSVEAVRKPLGSVVSRTLRSATVKTELPGVPDGDYVVLEYETSFENKRSSTETVTPMLDADGEWRVFGYYIK